MNRRERLKNDIVKIQSDLDQLQFKLEEIENQDQIIQKRIKEGVRRQVEYLTQRAKDIIKAVIQEADTVTISAGCDFNAMTFDPDVVTPLKFTYENEEYNCIGLAIENGAGVAYMADFSDNTIMVWELSEFDESASFHFLTVCYYWLNNNPKEFNQEIRYNSETTYSMNNYSII